MGHWSYVTFESVKKELNRATNNDQITNSALAGACVKSNEIKRVECRKICVMQWDANVFNRISLQTVISFLSIISTIYYRFSALLKGCA